LWWGVFKEIRLMGKLGGGPPPKLPGTTPTQGEPTPLVEKARKCPLIN